MTTRCLALAALAALACGRAPADDPKAEVWVAVRTGSFEDSTWRVRVDGGAPKQVNAPFGESEDRWKEIEGVGDFATQRVFHSPDRKKALFHEFEPDREVKKTIAPFPLSRLVLVDADGKNRKVVLNNVVRSPGFKPSPDGKSVVCVAAEGKEKWYPYRVTFDGGKPTKLSETVSLYPTTIVALSNHRFVYCPVTKIEDVRLGALVGKEPRGPAVLIDGKKETVLVKETSGVPAVSPDATTMARSIRNDRDETVVELTELATGKKEEVPLKAFNKDWKCRFGSLVFRPDGKALLVTFHVAGFVNREKGLLPGDRVTHHFGVIWLDGRKERTALFRVDQQGRESDSFRISEIEWSSAPAEKK